MMKKILLLLLALLAMFRTGKLETQTALKGLIETISMSDQDVVMGNKGALI